MRVVICHYSLIKSRSGNDKSHLPGNFFFLCIDTYSFFFNLNSALCRTDLALSAAGLVAIRSNGVIYRCQLLEIFRLSFCCVGDLIFVSMSGVARRNDICPGRIRLGCHIGPLNIVGANSASTCILYCYNDPIA